MTDTNTAISEEEVKKVASLARINLTPDEVKKFRKELCTILEYVEKINEVDTKVVEQTSHTSLINSFREDEAEESLTQEEALKNRKQSSKDGFFTIKSVLDHK